MGNEHKEVMKHSGKNAIQRITDQWRYLETTIVTDLLLLSCLIFFESFVELDNAGEKIDGTETMMHPIDAQIGRKAVQSIVPC